MNLLNQIKKDESFNGFPYIDPIVNVDKNFKQQYNKLLPSLNLTIGYGTLLPLSKTEAELLLNHRLKLIKIELSQKCSIFKDLPGDAQEILLNMAYNLGVPKLCEFKKMWKALSEWDFEKAADEMLDSRWAKEVKNRATKLANQMRSLAI